MGYLKNINEYISNYSANTTSWYNLILDTDYNHNKIKQNIRGLIRGEKYEYVEKKDLVMYHTLSDNNKPIGIILNKIYLELNKIDDFNKKYVKEYDFKYKVKDIIREI